MSELVSEQARDGIVTLSLNRPDVRNALSLELIHSLHASIERVASDTTVRVLILRGEGKVFCSGMDLRGVLSDAKKMGEMLHTLSRVMLALRRLPFPAIACVRGAAIGGGCGLLNACDLGVTHAEAKLGYPEVDLGICPAVIAPLLIRRIGAGRARAILLTGGVIGGAEACQWGLATHLAPEPELESSALAIANRLCAGGPKALAATKRWLAEMEPEINDETMDRAAELSAKIIQEPEAQQRLMARFEKRDRGTVPP